MLYFTNAPESYDYGYCVTVGAVHDRPDWRIIRVEDEDRFFSFQVPRYQSGLYSAVSPFSEDAAYYKLPKLGSDDDLCGAICGPNDCKGECHQARAGEDD